MYLHRSHRPSLRDDILNHISNSIEDSFHCHPRHRHHSRRSYSVTPPPVDRRVVHHHRRHRSADRHSDRDAALTEHQRSSLEQAVMAALDAGTIAAIRARNGPGGWHGEKGLRVVTAAVSAAAIDAFLARNPEVKAGRHMLEGVVGGLIVNRLVNGGKKS